MKNLYEKLQDYFNNTTSEQIKADWDSTSKYDEIQSPTVDEFVENTEYFHMLEHEPPDLLQESFFNNIKNPKFTSDFFF